MKKEHGDAIKLELPPGKGSSRSKAQLLKDAASIAEILDPMNDTDRQYVLQILCSTFEVSKSVQIDANSFFPLVKELGGKD
jgi:hypothetical protein